MTNYPDNIRYLLKEQSDNLIDGAPDALNTLDELAEAINDNATFHETVSTALGGKANMVSGGTENNVVTLTSTGDVQDGGFSKTSLDLELQRLKGISLTQNDLLYMYNHNTKLIATCEADEAWTNGLLGTGAIGIHGDDITNYKVGSQGISITNTSTSNGGAKLDLADKDLTKFEDGSASTTSDYIEFSVYVPDVTYLKYCVILFSESSSVRTPSYYYEFHKPGSPLLSDGWNHLKIQKSAFLTAGSSPDWSSIAAMDVAVYSTDGTSTSITIDAIRMTRKDPISANPNPFQIENDGVMERVFEISEGTPFLGYDGSTLCVKALSATNSLLTTFTFKDIYAKATGITAGVIVPITLRKYYDSDNNAIVFGNSTDELRAYYRAAGSWEVESEVAFAMSADDEVTLLGSIVGKSLYSYASKSGASASISGKGTTSISDAVIRLTIYMKIMLLPHLSAVPVL
jgi:hypothetical protein